MKVLNYEGVSLKDFLDDITARYEVLSEPISAEHILDWEFPPLFREG